MKSIDVYGLGNGIVDVLVEVTDEELDSLGYTKGTMELLDVSQQNELLDKFSDRDRKLVSGGSVANSIVLLAQLGARTAFSCKLGDDRFGLHYKAEFEGLNVELPNPLHLGSASGTSLILITPDAERTMRTSLGISGSFGPEEIEEELIRQSKWIFIEGYLFCNPERGHAAINYALDLAKNYNTKVAITLSDAWVVNEFKNEVEKVCSNAELIFANEQEAMALSGEGNAKDSFEKLRHKYQGIVVTAGENGCYVQYERTPVGRVEAFSVSPQDLTGAGDALAGAFIYGILQDVPVGTSAKCANFIAAHVIQKLGARVHGDVKELWLSAQQ